MCTLHAQTIEKTVGQTVYRLFLCLVNLHTVTYLWNGSAGISTSNVIKVTVTILNFPPKENQFTDFYQGLQVPDYIPY